MRYALETIFAANPNQQVSLVSFNTNEQGTISGFLPNRDVVSIRDRVNNNTVYVSLCNVIFITFNDAPDLTSALQYNCTTPECCCNTDLDAAIRTITGNTFPVNFTPVTALKFDVIDNTAAAYSAITVYGICNGIVWVQFQNTVARNSYGAIPLCSIFDVTGGPLTLYTL